MVEGSANPSMLMYHNKGCEVFLEPSPVDGKEPDCVLCHYRPSPKMVGLTTEICKFGLSSTHRSFGST